MAPKDKNQETNNHHQVHFEGVSKVTFEEVEDALHSAEDVANDMKTDADKAEEWIKNAKMAIDIASNSLQEAGKLAARVQKTAEKTAAEMTQLNVEQEAPEQASTTTAATASAEPGKAPSEDILAAAKQTQVTLDLDHNEEHCADEYEDVVALQKRAQEVQRMVGQSAIHLKETKSKLTGAALNSAMDMKEQADDLTVNLEETIEEIKAKRELRQTNTPVDAEDILKGDATEVDPLSRDKIDGVLDLSQASSRKLPHSTKDPTPPVKAKTPVCAEDVLKKGGALNADPVSLDKIDGLPKRTHNAEELAAKEHLNPSLTA